MAPKPKAHTERISTFLSSEQNELLKRVAKKKGLTVSAYIRLIILEHLANEKE